MIVWMLKTIVQIVQVGQTVVIVAIVPIMIGCQQIVQNPVKIVVWTLKLISIFSMTNKEACHLWCPPVHTSLFRPLHFSFPEPSLASRQIYPFIVAKEYHG